MPLGPSLRLALPGTLLIAALAAGESPAQTVDVDEGVFRLHVAGEHVGTETFSIRRSGQGSNATTVAQARIVVDSGGAEREMSSRLEMSGPGLRPSTYQLTIRGPRPRQIAGRLAGRRFSAKIVSGEGETMREYIADRDAVLVDDGIAHHYHFLASRASQGEDRVPVIVPQRNRQTTATIRSGGTESIEIGSARRQARRFAIELEGGPSARIWVDDEARLLRVAIPARDFVAERASPPR